MDRPRHLRRVAGPVLRRFIESVGDRPATSLKPAHRDGQPIDGGTEPKTATAE